MMTNNDDWVELFAADSKKEILVRKKVFSFFQNDEYEEEENCYVLAPLNRVNNQLDYLSECNATKKK